MIGNWDIWWADGWGYTDDEGEKHDEARGGAVKLDQAATVFGAEALADAWPRLAAMKYGRGVVVVLDRDGKRCGEARPARPFALAAG
jgi:hypothetical protein